ncbi:MAG: sulfotransferase [Rhodospirillales bacterium]|nr:sulfotransferase [Rhodospirillales bacterium]
MTTRRLFATGIARGGTSLVGRMVDAHPRCAIAIDAYLHIFRALRNSIVLAQEPDFDPTRPMEDFYFDAAQRRRLDILMDGSIDVAFSGADPTMLRDAIRRRASDESGDLAPFVDAIDGKTPRELIDSAFAQIERARPAEGLAVVGVKDLWIADLFPALAHGYPDARFLLIIRDPRDVVASALGFLSIDPSQVGHVLSMLRHWRKVVALAIHYSAHSDFAGRFAAVRYEDVVRQPEVEMHRICALLGVEWDPATISVADFKDYNSGGSWRGNSTFEPALDRISRSPVGRWRGKVAPPVVALVELVCGAEMRACGYVTEAPTVHEADILDFLRVDGSRTVSWRSDTGTPEANIALERARKAAIDGSASVDIPSNFLFPQAYERLRHGMPLFGVAA